MSCGAPSIASNCTSIPEIIGDANAMFDPYDTDSIKNLIQKALTDIVFRNSLIKKRKLPSTEIFLVRHQ